MEITVSSPKGQVPVTVLHVKGEINTETSAQLETQARQAIQSGTRHLLLDLSEVSYVSSYGVRAISQIFSWLREAEAPGGEAAVRQGLRDGTFKSPHLKLLNPSPNVRKLLTTAGVDMFLEIHSNLKQAVESFQS